MEELPEETKERYRRWWLSRSPEDRARLRAYNGKSVTPHEIVFLADSDGFPLTGGPGENSDRTPTFNLPDFLLGDEGATADPGAEGDQDEPEARLT
ncbi:MAG: hypothetical protein M3179_00505 [Actinomycetota bacterium]|nr:hypothetical protein [Actinomycetota bacterium]